MLRLVWPGLWFSWHDFNGLLDGSLNKACWVLGKYVGDETE